MKDGPKPKQKIICVKVIIWFIKKTSPLPELPKFLAIITPEPKETTN